MQLDNAIKKRHSIRRYSPHALRWSQIVTVLDAARLAPFAGNLCTIRLILVSDRGKIQQIADAARQDFIASAPHLVIVCSDPKIAMQAYGERGFKYSRQQVGASIQNMLLKITELNLASCWVGAFDDNIVRKILSIPEEIEVEAILPLAHKSIIREERRKEAELQSILYFEFFGNRRRRTERMAR